MIPRLSLVSDNKQSRGARRSAGSPTSTRGDRISNNQQISTSGAASIATRPVGALMPGVVLRPTIRYRVAELFELFDRMTIAGLDRLITRLPIQ